MKLPFVLRLALAQPLMPLATFLPYQ
ncbi:MAG: hypothetical protein JWP02_1238, partial [Acidimicrobiales bacterium]|nr:hypothetical protein [Acidimicrobiales bacterium]